LCSVSDWRDAVEKRSGIAGAERALECFVVFVTMCFVGP